MEQPKIIGGNTTVFISNMDEAIRFYTEVLGLKLTFRFRDHWATVEAGPGLTIGLHEARPIHPAPGTKGAMLLGLIIDEPIEGVVDRLSKKGVRFTEIVRDEYAGNFVSFEDPDGNPVCLHEPGGEDEEETKAVATGSARA